MRIFSRILEERDTPHHHSSPPKPPYHPGGLIMYVPQSGCLRPSSEPEWYTLPQLCTCPHRVASQISWYEICEANWCGHVQSCFRVYRSGSDEGQRQPLGPYTWYLRNIYIWCIRNIYIGPASSAIGVRVYIGIYIGMRKWKRAE